MKKLMRTGSFLAMAMLAAAAQGQEAWNTFGPGLSYSSGGGSLTGPTNTIFPATTYQAVRFSAQAGGPIHLIRMPLVHTSGGNDFSVELWSQALSPSGNPVLGVMLHDFGHIQGHAYGAPPVTIAVNSAVSITQGTMYWMVAKAHGSTFGGWYEGPALDQGWRGFTLNGGASWNYDQQDRRGALLVQIGAPCYANCDASTVVPVLNVDDFTCFINSYAAASQLPHQQQVAHTANCDGSTITPVLNVDDFTCFINAYAAGCP